MRASGGSVLFLAPEPIGPGSTGPARRTLKLAEIVARHHDVTLAAPAPSRLPEGPWRTLETPAVPDRRLASVLAAHDVVVAQVLPSPRQLALAMRHARRLVVDLIAPLALEAGAAATDATVRRAVVRRRTQEMVAHLAAADLVLCTNDRQRDLLIGAALVAGLDGLDRRIAVVPHGLDAARRARGRSALRTGALAGDDVRIAVWGGGMWSWLDPLTAVRAMERLATRRPDLRLAFVGFEHPDPAVRAGHAGVAERVAARVREHGLERSVVLRPRWLDRDAYADHLADADAGVSLHRQTLEGAFASRTRILDYLEAGLPVVASEGDTMSGVVARHAMGRVVPAGDVDACAAALDAVTGPQARRLDDPAALAPLRWDAVAEPLVAFCADPPPPRSRSAASVLSLAARQYPAFAGAVLRTDGMRGVARAAGRRVTARLRRR